MSTTYLHRWYAPLKSMSTEVKYDVHLWQTVSTVDGDITTRTVAGCV